MARPSIGRIVHYVSYGTPGGEYGSQCRAAVVAAVDGPGDEIALAVLNPTGLFFNACRQDEESRRGGTWHWPERVQE